MDFSHLAGWWALLLTVGVILFSTGHRMGRRQDSASPQPEPGNPHNVFYFQGMNFLLADQPDKAIEALVQAVRLNSETVEIYLSLGSLFRARGEVGRAIRIHQTIIARPNLSLGIRTAALYGLAEDFRQGGFVDRAVAAYRQVLEVDPHHQQALAGLQMLHEREGCWERALEALKRLEQVSGKPDPRREAHLRLKQGLELARKGETGRAEETYRTALRIHPGCVEAGRLLGEAQLARGDVPGAIASFVHLNQTRPSHFFLLVEPLGRAYDLLDDREGFERCLNDAATAPTAPTQLMVRWSRLLEERGDLEGAARVLRQGLARKPGSAVLADRLIDLLARREDWPQTVAVARGCLEHITAQQHAFQCGQCGFKSRDIYWKCPQCHHWDTMEPL
ncbi:MAG: tetratricopeptide repeat protein [Magnetococcales bacterium]|nr:tetratricopeptide repeat protein [Magnetococcales bacterium]